MVCHGARARATWTLVRASCTRPRCAASIACRYDKSARYGATTSTASDNAAVTAATNPQRRLTVGRNPMTGLHSGGLQIVTAAAR